MLRLAVAAAVAALTLSVVACSASGTGGRQVAISQRGDGCTPATVAATPGEKLQFVVSNDSGSDYEIEGIEGTRLEELVVPKGRTRKIGYTVPSGGGTHKVKCYVPAGVSTIIEVVAGGASTPTAAASPAGTPTSGTPAALKRPDTTVAVTLQDYTVNPSTHTAKAGVIRFIATNTSSDHVHELAVLQVNDDGTRQTLDEIEDIPAGAGGSLTLELTPGKYELACLIVPGEAGSIVDHYQMGMHADFTVE